MTGKDAYSRIEGLERLRSPHEYLWQEIGYLANVKHYNSQGSASNNIIPHTEIYDTTLRRKGRMQANGIASMLYPRDRDWLVILPPWHLRKNQMAVKKYREAGEAVQHFLRQSNFHHMNHGTILRRSFEGTGAMEMNWVDDDQGGEMMNFRRFETMRYLIDHDQRGKVDTFACEYQWPAYRAANEWGLKNLSSKLQSEAKDPTKRNRDHCFRVLIEKRPLWERDSSKGNKGMDYRVTVIEDQGKHTVLDSGRPDFNIVASRYEVFDSPWGYSPAWEILPDAYKANYAAKFMMVMGERAAVPPVIAPASMKEEGIGLGAAEVTYVSDMNMNARPFELTGGGNYAVGMEVLKMLQDSIDESYHGHLHSMFARVDRDMTATEVNQRRSELNAQADPTLTALNQDNTQPIVGWAMNSLLERGIIDLPEEGLTKEGKAITPQFQYHNAISMTHRQSQALESMGLIQSFAELAGAGIGAVDVLKLDEAARKIWRDSGLDEELLLSEEEFQDAQEAKAKQQKAAQGMEMAAQGASAAKDASAAGMDIEAMMEQAL